MVYDNEMKMIFSGKSQNEALARISVTAFITQLDPTISDVNDIKTAVSEAVTNAIIHGYENREGEVILQCRCVGREVYIDVEDKGRGIGDIREAMEPLYTSKPEMERSGMGFTVMESFMDKVEVFSELGSGTKVRMSKKLIQS